MSFPKTFDFHCMQHYKSIFIFVTSWCGGFSKFCSTWLWFFWPSTHHFILPFWLSRDNSMLNPGKKVMIVQSSRLFCSQEVAGSEIEFCRIFSVIPTSRGYLFKTASWCGSIYRTNFVFIIFSWRDFSDQLHSLLYFHIRWSVTSGWFQEGTVIH